MRGSSRRSQEAFSREEISMGIHSSMTGELIKDLSLREKQFPLLQMYLRRRD